jgi:enoyl-CoA hydratase
MAEVEAERQGSMVTISIDRPAARNAIALSTMGALRETLDRVTAEEISVLILRGAGDRAFVSGGDLKELATLRTTEEASAMAVQMRQLLDRVANLPMPTIAAINGHALGGGAEVAVACDLRVAVDDATMAFNQAQLAIMPAWGGVERLVQLVGRSTAMEMLLSRSRLTAEEAHRVGLVNRVVPRRDFEQDVEDFASAIAEIPAPVAKAIKATVNEACPNSHPKSEVAAVRAFAELWAADAHWEAVERLQAAKATRANGEDR